MTFLLWNKNKKEFLMLQQSLIRTVLFILAVLFSTGRLCAKLESPSTASVISLDGPGWLLATDPDNTGRDQKWFDSPRSDAKTIAVPQIIQVAFPGYHGVAWYWKDIVIPAHTLPQGRYLLRFWAVDYMADVWLDGKAVGGHEGPETPFILDVTDAVKPGQTHRLAVRVLNPTDKSIDGILLDETPHRCKVMNFSAGRIYNYGGIIDSVELILAPAVRVADVFIQPDVSTGAIQIETTFRNAAAQAVRAELTYSVSPSGGGEMLDTAADEKSLPPGDTVLKSRLQVKNPRLWQLEDPSLYQVSVAVKSPELNSVDQYSHKCGFREFAFKDGYFRLNGKRVFLKGSHTGDTYPVGIAVPINPDWLRRDLLNCKAMGFNILRFIVGIPLHRQLDYADEIGLMIYSEPQSSWLMDYSDQYERRFDASVREMILRDRNHPSVVIWGLLNETPDGEEVRHSVQTLPLIRSLDSTRLVLLNSGRWDCLQFSGASLPKGFEGWGTPVGVNPGIFHNSTDQAIETLGGTWIPGRLGMLSGMDRDDTILRWTAPGKGDYKIAAAFIDISKKKSTAATYVLHNGKPLFSSYINMEDQGPRQSFTKTVALEQNDTLEFAIDYGGSDWGLPYGYPGFRNDVIGLEVTVKSPDGTTHDAAKEFSLQKNPSGPWSYGVRHSLGKKHPPIFRLFEHRLLDTVPAIGSLSNPGTSTWQDILDDWHYYPRVPQDPDVIHLMRTLTDGRAVFMSEYGVGSGVDWLRHERQFQQYGYTETEDAVFTKTQRDLFLVDYDLWNMAEAFGRPEEFFLQSIKTNAAQRILGIAALRANPYMVGHSVTGTVDGLTGEGFTANMFRELKPGATDAGFDLWASLRWNTFVEPYNLYRGGKVRLDAVLSNEDVVRPGSYPVHLWVFGPDQKIVWEKSIMIDVPDPKTSGEQPFARQYFSEEVPMDAPTGQYRFVVGFESGAAATGGQSEFYVFDPAEMPAVNHEVVLWGDDPELSKWLTEHGIKVRPFDPAVTNQRELLLVSDKPAAPGDEAAFADLARRITRGSSAVFLVPKALKKDKQLFGWLPLANKPEAIDFSHWVYHADEWAKKHPIFDGLQTGGLMDYIYYRELITDDAWRGGDTPDQAVSGANDVSWNYKAGLTVGIWNLGAGRFTLNTLKIRKNLGTVPQAERLLRNLLNDASHDLDKPVVLN
jgi:hypothetical protein